MTTTKTGLIESITRKASSRNGNPRYAVKLYGGTAILTATDSAVAYEIPNVENISQPVTLTLDGRGNIIDIELADDEEESECEGHESLAGANMGVTVYCDGSCI